jgi:hypothetical protein
MRGVKGRAGKGKAFRATVPLGAPIWSAVPTITFTRGTADNASVTGLVTDPNSDPLSITHNGVALPSGVTFNSALGRFEYDGTDPGTNQTTTGHQLFADDGGADVVEFTLSSSTTGSKSFTIGHVFKQGDIPTGFDILADIPDFQAVVKNRWPDGSVMFAILSGRAFFSALVPRPISIRRGFAGSRQAITEAQLAALNLSVTLAFGSIGTITLASLINQTSTAKGVAGRRRTWISGPEMSEFHYYTQVGSDTQLNCWLFVRLYKDNSVWICAIPENGWVNVASPAMKSYLLTITANSTQRFNSTLTHKHHTRWGFEFWYGTDPAVTPLHDTNYIRATGLVPNHAYLNPSSAAFSGLVQTNTTAFQQANWPADMGGATADVNMGILTKNQALYITSGSTVAYNATIANAYAHGRYAVHYRDETTMKPIRVSQYPTLVVNSTLSGTSTTIGSGGATTPTPTGTAFTTSELWNASKAPSPAYLAYLLTGNYYFLEETQFVSAFGMLIKGTAASDRNGASMLMNNNSTSGTRGVAWQYRATAHAARVTPDAGRYVPGEDADMTMQDEFLGSLVNSAAAKYDQFGPGGPEENALGVIATTGTGNDTVSPFDGNWDEAMGQHDILVAVLGHVTNLGLPLTAFVSSGKLTQLRDFAYASAVGRLGTAADYCFRDAVQTFLPVGTPEAQPVAFRANWGAVYNAKFGGPSLSCGDGSALNGGGVGTSTFALGEWAYLIAAASFAVDHDFSGAEAAYARLVGASNFPASSAFFPDTPTWAIAPEPPAAAADEITTITLRSATSGDIPWSFAQPFKKGDVPMGQDVIADIPNFQSNVLSRFDDGSAAIVHICSGSTELTAGASKRITLKRGASAGGTPIDESDLLALAPNISVAFGPFGTVDLLPLIGQTSTPAVSPGGQPTNGRVWTWAEGPEMSEWRYYSRVGSDDHLHVFFDVQLYKNGQIYVDIVCENGWLQVASPGFKEYKLTITVNGTTRFDDYPIFSQFASNRVARLNDTQFTLTDFGTYVGVMVNAGHRCRFIGDTTALGTVSALNSYDSGTSTGTYTVTMDGGAVIPQNITGFHCIGHKHHQRMMFSCWYGTDPGTVPFHDMDYMMSTKLIPNYSNYGGTNAGAFSGLATSWVPFQRINTQADMPGTGADVNIGPITGINVLHVVSNGDTRAYTATILNAKAHGKYATHYRDETTMRSYNYKTYPLMGLSTTNPGVGPAVGPGSASQRTPAPISGGGGFTQDEIWDAAHHPSSNYYAYLITGRPYFMEEVQFSASFQMLAYSHLNTSSNIFGTGDVFASGQVREQAWKMRTMGHAARVTREFDSWFRDDLMCPSILNTARHWHNQFVAVGAPFKNNLGMIQSHGGNGSTDLYDSTNGRWDEPTWMHDFLSGSLGHIMRLGLPLQTASSSDPGNYARLLELRDESYKSPVGRLGSTGPTQFGYTRAAQYFLSVASVPGPNPGGNYYANWGAAYQAIYGTVSDKVDGSALENSFVGEPAFAVGYWGNLMYSIASAVEDGSPGALTAWNRMTSASNWAQNAAFFKELVWYSFRPPGV